MRRLVLASLVLALPLSLAALAEEQAVKPAAATVSAAPTLSGLAFLAGSWRGSMGDDFVEEIWSKPHGTSMMGAFRWVNADGTPGMFEMLTITQESTDRGDATLLRLRHYTPTLTAKKDADKPLTLRLTQSSASRAAFEPEKDAHDLARVSYELVGDRLNISVEFAASGKPDEKPREALKFTLSRG